MEKKEISLANIASQRSKTFSRCWILVTGTIAGVAGALSLPSLTTRVSAASNADKKAELIRLRGKGKRERVFLIPFPFPLPFSPLVQEVYTSLFPFPPLVKIFLAG